MGYRGSEENGAWLPIDLTSNLPSSVRVLLGNNTSQMRTGYQLSKEHRDPIDKVVRNNPQLMILASQNELVDRTSSFLGKIRADLGRAHA